MKTPLFILGFLTLIMASVSEAKPPSGYKKIEDFRNVLGLKYGDTAATIKKKFPSVVPFRRGKYSGLEVPSLKKGSVAGAVFHLNKDNTLESVILHNHKDVPTDLLKDDIFMLTRMKRDEIISHLDMKPYPLQGYDLAYYETPMDTADPIFIGFLCIIDTRPCKIIQIAWRP